MGKDHDDDLKATRWMKPGHGLSVFKTQKH